MAEYGLLKALHVLGAVLLVGNVTVTGVWALLMYRAQSEVPFRPVARAILWTDLLTLLGGTLLTVTGILMIRQAQMPWLDLPWLVRGISALITSTLAWLIVLLPIQVRLARLGPGETSRLRTLFRAWSAVGWAATVLLYVAIWYMVTKS
jgi:uncharacterized membrane protein